MEAEKNTDDVTIISPRRIRTEYALGDGSYGIVYKAVWTVGKGDNTTETDVAVKIPKNPTLKDHAWTEVTRMSLLNHPNILSLHGITFPRGADSAPWIVMEFMSCGSLHSYVKSYPGGEMTSTVMVKLAYGIACGMAYLHHEMNQRHGDLAARNCLVGPQETVKIGDFGKFEDYDQNSNHDSDNNPLPCPLRWMAPENLPTDNRPPHFTRKGDIFAFGTVLFEIWSKGEKPFEGLSDQQVMAALADGDTPTRYHSIGAKWFVINLMDACWQFDPSKRPNFKYIKGELEDCAGHVLGLSDL